MVTMITPRITMSRMHFGFNFLLRLLVLVLVFAVAGTANGNQQISSNGGANGKHSSSAAGTLTITPDEELAHFVNQSRIASCGHSNPDTKLRWRTPKNAVIEEKRGRVHIERKDNALLLIFEKIERSDQGNWTCEVVGPNKTNGGTPSSTPPPPLQKSFKMIVYEPISFRDTSNVQTAVEDKDATIRCEVKGHPEPSVSWYFNGQPLYFAHNGRYSKLADGMSIKKVTQNDTGEYTCKAFQISTTGSSFEEKTIRLNIKHKPYLPKWKPSVVDAYGYVHGMVNLTCEAAAEPAANFTWYAGGKKLTPKSHTIHYGQHVSMLQISIKTSSSFGKYKCEAKNELGSVSQEINLKEGTKPDPPSLFQLRGVNSDTLDIDVGATKSHDIPPDPTTVIGYRFELMPTEEYSRTRSWDHASRRDFDVADGATYLLVQLIPDTKYLIRVAARNAAGLSDWTEVKEFSTHPLQPHGTSGGTVVSPVMVAPLWTLLCLVLVAPTMMLAITPHHVDHQQQQRHH
ncbi:limbic system-associated membrane protein isoform X2 [Anopheles darlingi]|uniref:limbic system-associated membrane protein isoform X2 n=1 Tax=Anopheles darlingi TaxID=43151 RepID=UPI0020FFFDAC|nr:limbic system-associated membrane protein isoform X2 [Anopheles darlingi]